MILFDTNAVLRYLLQDNQEMALEVCDQMEKATCTVPVEVIAEAVYVLTKVYKIDRDQVRKVLLGFMAKENVEIPFQNVVMEAIEVYVQTKFDFVDCLMVGYAKYEQCEIFTFDKKLKKRIAADSK